MPIDLDSKLTSAVKDAGLGLKVGAATGLLGFCAGGAVGILRSAHPGIAAAYTGAQFFTLGLTFTYTRQVLVAACPPTRTRQQELICSTAAATTAGALSGRFWGTRSILPWAIVTGAVGFFGQRSVHKSEDAPHTKTDRRSLMDRLADSRFSPMKTLSNEEYERMLLKKLVKVEVEMSLVDEKLAALKDLSTVSNED